VRRTLASSACLEITAITPVRSWPQRAVPGRSGWHFPVLVNFLDLPEFTTES
jgi:hypothetical protein